MYQYTYMYIYIERERERERKGERDPTDLAICMSVWPVYLSVHLSQGALSREVGIPDREGRSH